MRFSIFVLGIETGFCLGSLGISFLTTSTFYFTCGTSSLYFGAGGSGLGLVAGGGVIFFFGYSIGFYLTMGLTVYFIFKLSSFPFDC